jgi:hypothetical protein
MAEAVARILGDLGAKVHIVDIEKPKIACAALCCRGPAIRGIWQGAHFDRSVAAGLL